MSFLKIGSAAIISSFGTAERVAGVKVADDLAFDRYKTSDDFLYVRVRAISSRTNKNWDSWGSDDLADSYRTFIGKPVFIDHNNSNPARTRGVVVDAALHVEDMDKISSLDPYYATYAWDHEKPPTWVELLLEVDAKSFPRLAKAIVNKDIDGVSMGANVEYTLCTHCHNRAEDPSQFCSHILNKGADFDYWLPNGQKTSKKSAEICKKIGFFEISFVFDPADETALVRDIRHAHTASVRAAVENEGNNRHVFSEAFGDQTSDMWLSGIAREAWNDGYNDNVNSPDPRSAAWQAAVDAVSGAGFPEEAVQVANKLAQTFDIAAGIPEEMQGGDMTYEPRFDLENNPMHPTLREMALERPNNSANPVMSKTAAPGMTPQIDLTSIPQDVDTLRAEKPCPLCGNTTEAGQCPTCGWESEPEGLDNPDLTKAKPNLPPPTDTQPIQSDQPPPGQPPMNGVPSGGLPPNGTGQGGSMGGVSAHFGLVYSNDGWGPDEPQIGQPGQYRAEVLGNGFIRVDDRSSGLTGLYKMDGTYAHGDLRSLRPEQVLALSGRSDYMDNSSSGLYPPEGPPEHWSRFGTVYIDSAINLISEKTAAQPNLDGGRINTQEKPLLPISRQVTDRPKNQKTVSDSLKPVESKTKQGN